VPDQQTMRAAVIESRGVLAVRDVPRPTVSSPGDVVVKVVASGVCRTDLETIEGDLAAVYGVPDYPYVPGHETTGVVEAVGTAVTSVEIGDPVILHPLTTCGLCSGCRSGRDMYCTHSTFAGVDAVTWGGWAEYVKVGERALVPVPEGSDLIELAPYTDAGLTAYHAIERVRHLLTADATVVVMGVGGVGHFGLQLARRAGSATIIALEPSPERARFAAELGADHVVSVTGDAAAEEVSRLSGGRGADVVIDFVGNAESPDLGVAMLAKGGTLSIVGALGDLSLNTLAAVVREISIVFNIVGNHHELATLAGLAGSGMRSPYVAYGLEDAVRAVDDLRHGRLSGRAVLIP